jgi:hypothetical protein
VVATRDICPGEELLILYGEEYWRSSRWSFSLLRKAALHYSRESTRQLWSDLINHAEIQEKRRCNPHTATDSLPDTRRADLLLPILPLKHPCVINPQPSSNFKYGSWNVGSNLSTAETGNEKMDHIHRFFLSSGLSCLFLLDVRQTKSSFKFLQFTFQQLIPGAAVLLFPSTSPSPTMHRRRSVTMGGTIAIVHPKWRHAIVRSKSDNSGLSIVTKITFKISSSLPSSRPQIFEIIGAYIPPRSSNTAGACTIQRRLQDYLAASSANPHSTITPRAYAQTVVQKWCLRGQAKGRFVGIAGDLNGTADIGAQNNVRDWLSTLHVRAPLSEILLPQQEYFTFFNGVE